jgi:retron-type reverse transcriptase
MHQPWIKRHDAKSVQNISLLHDDLVKKKYRTSSYVTFTIREPKERVIFRLPYYPDRIVHHAIMNVLKPVFISVFTADTYSCIEGRGIHSAAKAVKKALQDKANTTYCLKIDIRKFYPSVNHGVLKNILRKKIADADLLWLLDEIIDSAEGLPIGNYLSQYFANFYLTYFDHWIKEEKKVKYYFRYADDMVFLSGSKQFLHELLFAVRTYLHGNLKLELKKNHQIFPVKSRGINYLGYVFFHTHTRIRPYIKKRFLAMLSRNPNKPSIDAYLGWMKHGNCMNLINKQLYGRA